MNPHQADNLNNLNPIQGDPQYLENNQNKVILNQNLQNMQKQRCRNLFVDILKLII